MLLSWHVQNFVVIDWTRSLQRFIKFRIWNLINHQWDGRQANLVPGDILASSSMMVVYKLGMSDNSFSWSTWYSDNRFIKVVGTLSNCITRASWVKPLIFGPGISVEYESKKAVIAPFKSVTITIAPRWDLSYIHKCHTYKHKWPKDENVSCPNIQN